MSSVEWAITVAGEFPVTALERRGSGFECTLTITLPSGENFGFNLEVHTGNADHLNVKERVPGRLPRCCPDRHITPRNQFCLNWITGVPQPIVDDSSARAWWGTLWDFLTRQLTAGKIGRWPGPVRAHGIGVIHQDRAERCAAKLGTRVLENVLECRFATRIDQRRGRNRIELVKDGAVVNRIHICDRTLTNHQVPCLCPKGDDDNVPIGLCQDHAVTAAQMIDAIHRWAQAEREYFAELRRARVKCCQTLHRCGLQ